MNEGTIEVVGGRVWFRRTGGGAGAPLLVLHGGPGAGWDYLETLERLATDREVIFYDQLGTGKADKPDDASLWTVERFVREVETVREALGLERVHILGQSWGGWLAIEYAITKKPAGLVGLVLANTSASAREFVAGTKALRAELPIEVQETMARCEATGDYHNPDYERAVLVFYQRHLCRLTDWPPCILRTAENLAGNQVYETMNGPNEFTVVGRLKDWDRTHQLGEIGVPTLILVGRYDEIVPACSETLHRGIPGSELHIFEESSHMPHLEEEAAYMRVVGSFLRRVE
jgi:proline-specific peptidase